MKNGNSRMHDSIAHILSVLKNGYQVNRNDIALLLGLKDAAQIEVLFKAAREAREKYFKNKIFLYGFLYFSTYCRNNCRFCQYRKSNKTRTRYRKTLDQILAAASELAETGVHLIDLTMGEDPELYASNSTGMSRLASTVKSVQQKTGLPIMLSPGVIPDDTLKQMAQIGTTWYACYQETHNRELFAKLRFDQSFQERIEKKQLAKKQGMLIEEGILINVGERLQDVANSIAWMRENQVDQARAMTFVPQSETPMSGRASLGNIQELITIAVMRLVLPDRLIPASLDVDGLDGLKARLNAGANVVTSIVPPEKGLAGVANHSLDIEDSRRSLENIMPILESCGLKAALPEEYQTWIRARRTQTLKFHDNELRRVC